MQQPSQKRYKWISFPMLICLFSVSLILTMPSCKTTDQERQAKKIAKVEKAKKKKAEKEYEKAQKRHMKIQDKKTRKRIVGNKSKMMDQTKVKKRSFWQRIFPKKDKTCPKE